MDATASAIADPVRREIVTMLRRRSLNASEIAAPFPISRPAVSRHLRVLLAAGLVTVEAVGRQRRYRTDPAPLLELAGWLERFGPHWTSHLDALETEVHRTRRERSRRAAPAAPARNGQESA